MPGFGSGPFGHHHFGEWKWSRRVLFEQIPEVYRTQDQIAGGLLEAYSEGLRPSFDNLRRKIRDLGKIRDPLYVRTQYDQAQSVKLGPVLGDKGTFEQSGVAATVDALQQFNAPTGRFRLQDVGKELFVSNSQFTENNRRVTVTSIVSGNSVVTDPFLVTDGGPLQWELRTKVVPATTHLTIELRGGDDVLEMFPGWLLFDGDGDFLVLTRAAFPVPVEEKQLLTEQEGVDGTIDVLGRFRAASISLNQRDVGKKLSFVNSEIVDNNGKFEIVKVVDFGGDLYAELDADPILAQDSGFTWALLPYPQIDISGVVIPRGVIEQEGLDMDITASAGTVTVQADTANFTSGDIGKLISVRGSNAVPSNDCTLEILAVVSQNTLTLAQRLVNPLLLENDLCWELRTPTSNKDSETAVRFRAPSMISVLAPDYGIEIDTQEAEDRQRRWVKNISGWIEKKGVADSYRIIGSISGFDVDASQLYHFSASLLPSIPAANVLEIGENVVGRFGVDGTLSLVGARYRFSAPTAQFVAGDIGRNIHISSGAVAGNNKLYQIEAVISPTVVEFGSLFLATLPEANNGALGWAIVRLYTDLAPLLPLYDEILSDLMTQIVNSLQNGFKFFSADRYCWEANFHSEVPIVPMTASQLAPGIWRIGVIGGYLNPRPATTDTPYFASTPEVVIDTGNWFFTALKTQVSSGAAGAVTGTAPNMVLTDAFAAFTENDVGRYVRLTNPDSTDAGVFQITAVTSPTSLSYFNGLGSIPGAAAVTWAVFEGSALAVETVPVRELPAVNIQDDLGTFSPGGGAAFTKVGNQVTMTDPARTFGTVKPPGHHVHIKGATSSGNNGIFVIISSTNTTLVYENTAGVAELYPGAASYIIGRATYYFNVASATNPIDVGANEPGILKYRCPFVSTCDYCGSSKVLLRILPTLDLLAEGGVQAERMLERVLLRMDEVTPAHVETLAITAPVFHAAGDDAVADSVSDLLVSWPDDHQPLDVALLIVVGRYGSPSPYAIPAGWLEMPDSPQANNGAAANARVHVFWRRAVTATEAQVTVPDVAGDGSKLGKILTFRGCAPTGNPFDVTAGDAIGVGSASVVIPGDATTGPNRLVAAIVAHTGIDANGAQTSGFANESLSLFGEIVDACTNSSVGYGFAVAVGIKAVAGVYAATTATLTGAATQARVSIALKGLS